MTVGELYIYLDNKIPASLSLPWDNDGLAVCPDRDREVKRVLVALDPTERMVNRAADEGYDVLLCHHPMLFCPAKSVSDATGAGRKILRAVSAGVGVMCFHTRLDAVSGGVNDVLATRLGVEEPVPFGKAGEMLGRIGTLKVPMTFSAFCAKVRSALDGAPVFGGDAGRPVHRVAVLGGSGKDEIGEAIRAGADTFVTGALDYHSLTDAPELGINLVEAGHFHTENPVCERLAEWVREAIPTAEIEIAQSYCIRFY